MSSRYCLVKYLYWEVSQLDRRKDKHLKCEDCPLRKNCKDYKEVSNE